MTNQQIRIKNKKGFSLLEMLIAMFIFVLIILASVSVFAAINKSRRDIKSKQQNIETASAAMELMAKSIRMNTAARNVGTGRMEFYNAQSGRCTRYDFNASTKILRYSTATPEEEGTPPVTIFESCIDGSVPYGSYVNLVSTGLQDVRFDVVESDEDTIGRAIINMKLNDIWLQNSVSFRDYTNLW